MTRTPAAALAATTLLTSFTVPAVAVFDVATAQAATTRTITGPWYTMRWGDVRVKLTVRGKKITGVQASYPTERPRSAQINQRAIPILRSEVLSAQSARINTVGGATMTSEAYIASLKAAVKKI